MLTNTINLAKNLCLTNGVSGNEFNVVKIAIDYLKDICDYEITTLGNVIFKNKNISNAPKIMLTAHIDQIGMIVTNIEENGFLRVNNVGGLDGRLLPSQRVLIHTKNKTIKGVIASIPPHLQNGKEEVLKIEDVLIDTGLTTEDSKIISIGDIITFDSEFEVLNKKYLSSLAMDNRIGCVCVINAFKELIEKNINCNINLLLTVQEETGSICVGATTGTMQVNPDYAVVVDVSFANGFNVAKDKCGQMGKGPMIGISPVLNRESFYTLQQIAKEKDIPYQIEVMGGRTGTDSDDVATALNGVKTSLISIPLRYMHTPVEIVNIEDVINSSNLIVEFVKEKSNVK